MAQSQIKVLLDELAAILAQMGALDEGATDALDPTGEEAEVVVNPESAPAEAGGDMQEGESDMAERSMKHLMARADEIKKKIAFYEAKEAKEAELRAVLERAAPASRSEAPKARVFAVPKSHGTLRAFRGPDAAERAYRAGMHIRGYVFGDDEAKRWCRDHGVESRAQAGGINALGGVLTSPEMSSELIRLVEEYGAYPQFARRVSMNSDTLVIARRKSGLAARPVGENIEITDSNVEFDNVQLVAKIWGVANRIPNSLIEDSVIDLADTMAVEAAQAFAEAFDNSGFVGDGSSQYHGTVGAAVQIVDGTHNASVVTAKTNNNTFDMLEMRDFASLIAKLPMFAKRNAAFYISPVGFGASMSRLAMNPAVATSGAGTQTAGGSGNSAADVGSGWQTLQFLGFPVRLVHSLESGLTGTGGKVACLFGDLSQAATFGERRAISVTTARERYIEYDQTLIHATTRNAINVHDLGDNVKAGPLVALKFAA